MSDEVVVVIPARGGSRGVPRKNVRRVGGVPLIARAVRSARAVAAVDRVVVSTDDPEIAEVAAAEGAEIIVRPARIAGDEASSESALDHALDELAARGVAVDTIVFLQATSPFIDPADIDDAVARVRAGLADVVFSAVPSWGFLWRPGEEGAVEGVNHDPAHRPRRQDRSPEYLETGAFYVLDGDGYRRARHRFFGVVAAGIVADSTAIEIDTEQQLLLAAAMADVLDPAIAAIDVDAVVTDFDGVHTDDRVHVAEDGTESVVVSRSDGMGVAQLLRASVPVLILSTERNRVVAARARKLGVEVLHGLDDKAAALTAWAEESGIPLDRIAYLGNDVNDIGCLELVGWPVATPEAHPLARAAARVVLARPGGSGAVRELAERVLATRTADDPDPNHPTPRQESRT